MDLKWDEVGYTILIDKKVFYRLLKLIQKTMTIKILSHTGSKLKI